MAPRAFVPEQLREGPLTLAEAVRAGLTPRQLTGGSRRRTGPRTYAWAGTEVAPDLLLRAAQRHLPAEAVFSGPTAAWLYGLGEWCLPAEVSVPRACGITATRTVAVRRVKLGPGDALEHRGLRATSVPRTLLDLAQRLPLPEVVVAADAALHRQLVSLAGVRRWVLERRGAKGIVRLRHALDFAEPAAESPMESRLRMLLVLAGLPRPRVQATLRDHQGMYLGRADLYYPAVRLAIEVDGATHRASPAEDNRRQNAMIASGYRLLRFTAGDLSATPEAVVARTRSMLRVARRRAA